MFVRLLLFLILCIITESNFAQKRSNIWCFGDSAGIDFTNINNPFPFQSGMDSRGSCASISDSSGGLQMYAANCSDPIFFGTLQAGKLYNKQHQSMQNGDSLYSLAWYNEMVLIPFPNEDSLFLLFSIGVTHSKKHSTPKFSEY